MEKLKIPAAGARWLNPGYFDVDLSQLEMKQINGLWYLNIHNDSEHPLIFHVDSMFKESLCRYFNLFRNPGENVPFDFFLNAVKEREKNHKVTIYVNQAIAKAVAMIKADHNPVDLTLGQELYDWLKHNKHEVSDIKQHEKYTWFIYYNDRPFVYDPRYRSGGLVKISHIDNASIKIIAVLRHESFQNYAVIDNKALCLFVPTRKRKPIESLQEAADVIEYSAGAEKPEFYNIFVDRIKSNRNANASVKECMKAVELMIKEGFAEDARRVDLPRIFDEHNVASPDEKGPKWASTTSTHHKRMDLFNMLISIRPDTPLAYGAKIGEFLFSVGDLEGINDEVIPECADDSEIISDFECIDKEEDETDWGDEDIKSDFLPWKGEKDE